MVVTVWAVLEISLALEIATVPESMSWLRLFVGLLLARMWNIELNSFAATMAHDNDPPGQERDDDP